MPETGRWKDGARELAAGDDPLTARAAELLKRFERAEEDEPWTPANIAGRWSRLEREIQQQGRRKPSGEIWALSAATVAVAALRRKPTWEILALSAAPVSVAALAIALVWSHQSASRLPPTARLTQSPPVARALVPAAPSPNPAPMEPRAEPWTTWPRTDLGPNGTLWSEPGSVMRLPASPTEHSTEPREGYVMQLDRGSLCAEVAARALGSEGPFRVKTRQLDVTVIGTHFCVEAGPDLSSVSVQRGRVRVAHEGVSVVLGAGESIRSDAPPLRAALPPPQRAWRDRPVPGNPLNVQVAARDEAPEPLGSLSLENELYQRALQEARHENHPQAAGLLADYLKRFPTGLYAPEAGSELATELGLAGRPGEALAAARERLRSFPRDPHDGAVKLLMAGLLREDLNRPAEALAVYEDLLTTTPGPAWRAEALFGKAVCEERLGDSAVARELWHRYQEEYPGGRRAAEVERLLGE